jgi:hypothetical protein
MSESLEVICEVSVVGVGGVRFSSPCPVRGGLAPFYTSFHAPSAYDLFLALEPLVAIVCCVAVRLVTGGLAADTEPEWMIVGGCWEGATTISVVLVVLGDDGVGGVGRCFHFLSVARVPKA